MDELKRRRQLTDKEFFVSHFNSSSEFLYTHFTLYKFLVLISLLVDVIIKK